MYLPPLFAETRTEELHRIISEHPLGVLVTHTPDGLDANHVPFVLEPRRGPMGTLIAHVAASKSKSNVRKESASSARTASLATSMARSTLWKRAGAPSWRQPCGAPVESTIFATDTSEPGGRNRRRKV